MSTGWSGRQVESSAPLLSPSKWWFLAAAGLLLVPLRSEAADEVRLETVDVVGDREKEPPTPTVEQEPTGFGTVIEAKDFAGQRIEAAELLLQAPGVRIHRGQAGASLMLRGTSADQSLILLDGIPLNAAAGGGVDLRTIPASLLERITVLRGNEGARYGAGALGGAALLETRSLRGSFGDVRLSGGSFSTWELDGTLGTGNDKLQGLAAVSLRTTGGTYPTEYDPTPNHPKNTMERVEVTNNDDRSIGLLLKGSAAVGTTSRLHALANGYLAERGLPGNLYFPSEDRRSDRRLLSALRFTDAPSPDVHYELGLEWKNEQLAVWSGDRGVYALPDPTRPGGPWQVENLFTARTGVEWAPADWTSVRLEASAGGDWLQSVYQQEDVSRERLSLALSDELYLGTTVTLAPALRWDRIGDIDGLSPRVGIAWRPLAPLELRSNWGRSFRVPSLGELYVQQGRMHPNPDLAPETGWTADVGAVVRLPGTLVQLTAFYSRIEDLILYEVMAGGYSKPFNFSDAEIVGGEAEAVVQPFRWLTLSASYSLTETRNLRDDPRFFQKELPFRPRERLQARAMGRSDRYEGWLQAHNQSRQFLNRANTASLPASTTMSAGAGMKVLDGSWPVWLSAQMDNAFDALLIDELGFPQPGRVFTLTLRSASLPEATARGI